MKLGTLTALESLTGRVKMRCTGVIVEIRRNTERGHVSEPAGARKSVACHRRQREDRRIEAWGMKRRGRTVSHVPYYGIFVRITVKLCRHVLLGRSARTLRCTYSRENEGPLTASQGRVRGRLARGGGFPGDSATGRVWWRPGEVREVCGASVSASRGEVMESTYSSGKRLGREQLRRNYGRARRKGKEPRLQTTLAADSRERTVETRWITSDCD